MGVVTRIEGVRAAELPEDLRERFGLSPGDVVDLRITKRPSAPPDAAALDAAISRAQERAAGSAVTAATCTDFLYDEDGLPA